MTVQTWRNTRKHSQCKVFRGSWNFTIVSFIINYIISQDIIFSVSDQAYHAISLDKISELQNPRKDTQVQEGELLESGLGTICYCFSCVIVYWTEGEFQIKKQPKYQPMVPLAITVSIADSMTSLLGFLRECKVKFQNLTQAHISKNLRLN